MNEQQPFEAIRKSDEAGREYWSARNLGPLLDYKEWRNFYKVIAKAIISCEASGHPSADHFVETNKMVELGSGASRNLEDFHLSPLRLLSGSAKWRSVETGDCCGANVLCLANPAPGIAR